MKQIGSYLSVWPQQGWFHSRVLEAMKMEHRLKSPRDGIISLITSIEVGEQVKEGEIMFELESE